MDILVLNCQKKYLKWSGVFEKLVDRNIVQLEYELVNQLNDDTKTIKLFRLKTLGNKYLTLTQNVSFVTEKSDDNLFVENNYHCILQTVSHKFLTVDSNMFVHISNSPSLNSVMHISSSWFKDIEQMYINGLFVLKMNIQYLMENEFNTAYEIINKFEYKNIYNLLELDKSFQQLLSNSYIVECLNKLFNHTNYHLTSFYSNKLSFSNNKKHYWHVDYPYNTFVEPFCDKELYCVQVMILLTDFTEENGATQYIAGSQKYGTNPNNDVLLNHKVKTIVAKKGSVIVSFGNMWHTEGVNTTSDSRIALIAKFSPLCINAEHNVLTTFKYKDNGLRIDNNKLLYI